MTENQDGDVSDVDVPDADVTAQANDASWSDSDALARTFLSLAEAIPDGVILLDGESDVAYANPAVEDILGHSPDDLVGESKLRIIPPRLRPVHLAAIQRYLETGERNVDWSYVELPGQHAAGHEVPLGVSLNDFVVDGERYFVGLFRDVTRRKRAEREAATRLAQQEAVAALGRSALEATDIDSLLSEAADVLASVVDAEVTAVLEFDPEREGLTVRAAHGLPADQVGETMPASALNWDEERGGSEGERKESEENQENEDRDEKNEGNRTSTGGGPPWGERFVLPEGTMAAGATSGVGVRVGSETDPWGALVALDAAPPEFAGPDANVLESVANVLASAIDRNRRVRELEFQRAQLDVITQVYRVVREIQRAIVAKSDREEIERTVCERLLDIDPYEFVWIGELDLSAGTLSPRTSAGEGADYLDDVEIHITDRGDMLGPSAEALRTERTYVVRDVSTDESFRPWRDAALRRGFRSAAAVPITYRGTTFGLIAIYAGEPDAFGPEVRDVLDTLGGLLGHAFAAIGQRRALYSEEVTEVELRIEGLVEGSEPNALGDHRLEFDRVIPVDDDRFLMYASTTLPAEDLDRIEEVTAVESVDLLSDSGDERRVELELVDPPVSTVVTGVGGRLRGGVLEGNTLTITAALPPTADVKQLVDRLRADNPDATVTLQQRVTREREERSDGDTADVLDPLTERQRAALETAYEAGYFEWPRESNGSDVADALGVANATFSSHLRAAERRVFERLLATAADGDETADGTDISNGTDVSNGTNGSDGTDGSN